MQGFFIYGLVETWLKHLKCNSYWSNILIEPVTDFLKFSQILKMQYWTFACKLSPRLSSGILYI